MEDKKTDKDIKEIQFIVNEGIIYSKKDIMRLLWDLGYIAYFEIRDGKVIGKGKGLIMRVSENSDDPTLFLNGRIYINVNSVDYMSVRKVKESMTLYELHCGDRVLKLVPDMKKHAMPALRYVTDPVMGLDILTEEEFPPDAGDDFREDYPFEG